jgi:hypothetical protein
VCARLPLLGGPIVSKIDNHRPSPTHRGSGWEHKLGHLSIEETEGTYGHLDRERHERRVDLDPVLGIGSRASTGVHGPDAGGDIEGQLRDVAREDFVVEGKGFEPSTSALRTPRSPN